MGEVFEMQKKNRYTFEDLLEIMRILRSENGCPWDREQTHDSLKKYLIEEAYEVLEAIDSGEKAKMCEELGDLLLQVVFHSQIAFENNSFSMDDVIDAICKKLIIRHTHVFGDDNATTADDVMVFWEANKKKEKNFKTQTEVLKSVPANLPALMRSYKVQQKAADVGFDWDDIKDAILKLYEEIAELQEVYKSKDVEIITDEVGDVLFSIVNVCRFLKIQPEIALSKTTDKFIKRFEFIEKEALNCGKKLKDMTLQEMDELWEKAKKQN